MHLAGCIPMKMFVVDYEEILNDVAKMQHTAFGKGLIWGKRTKFALQIARKAQKCPLEYVNFQKVLGEHAPGPPGVIFVSQFASI